jgi:hypothetical protein
MSCLYALLRWSRYAAERIDADRDLFVKPDETNSWCWFNFAELSVAAGSSRALVS